MADENILVLNGIEKQIAGILIQKLSAGEIPARDQHTELLDIQKISYEYSSGKQEKSIRGIILGCPYKLRYKDKERVFFSAWDSKDVCSIFYDKVVIILAMSGQTMHFSRMYLPFDVDLHTESYVFFAGGAAGSFVAIADHIANMTHKISYSSQYVLSVFDESDDCEYNVVIQKLKTDGYSKVRILRLWIRGEILYYAIVDGAVLRPEQQRALTAKEEEDIIRKVYKAVNNKFRHVDLKKK
jgi:hypothetical protein